MAFDFADAKTKMRRRVHKLAAVLCTYQDEFMDAPVNLYVRWHNRIIPAETINNTSEIISGVERLIFDEAELAEKEVALRRGGIVIIPQYDAMELQLEFEEPNDGPVTTAWSVSALT
jgi:hypothetical protein